MKMQWMSGEIHTGAINRSLPLGSSWELSENHSCKVSFTWNLKAYGGIILQLEVNKKILRALLTTSLRFFAGVYRHWGDRVRFLASTVNESGDPLTRSSPFFNTVERGETLNIQNIAILFSFNHIIQVYSLFYSYTLGALCLYSFLISPSICFDNQ
jgi:hypothetical protein